MLISQYTTHSLEELSKNGIYKIYHIDKPDVIYIGSARGVGKSLSTKGFYKRFYDHIRSLKKKHHVNCYLQSTVNKYGIEGIRFEIIEFLELKTSDILNRENYYLQTHPGELYNFCRDVFSIKLVRSIKPKISRKGVSNEGCKKEVFVYNKLGNTIYRFDSNLSASKGLNLDIYKIYKYIKKKYIFNDILLTHDEMSVNEILDIFKNFVKRKPKSWATREVIQYSHDWKELKRWESVEFATKDISISASYLFVVIRDEKLYKNFHYKYGKKRKT